MMTVELLKATLPKALQINATQEWVDQINNIALDPEVAEEVRSNFLSYTKVLQEGKFKTESYLDAITYVTHKLMGYSNQDAYIRTFPARYQALVAKGISAKDLSAYVAAYHKNKLVNLIMEQSVVPSWLLNQDIYQKAINTQFELMTDVDVSAKVRSDAANSILTHLKPPEVQKVQIDVGVKREGGINDLMETMRQLALQQQELIQAGVPARQVARQKLMIEGEVTDAEFVEVVAQPVAEPARAVAAPVADPMRGPGVGALPPGGAAVARPRGMFDAQPGNPGVPPGPLPGSPAHQSLFSPKQPSASGEDASSEGEAATEPGAPARAARQASTEGGSADSPEGEKDESSKREAVTRPRSSVSLFDPTSFPIEG